MTRGLWSNSFTDPGAQITGRHQSEIRKRARPTSPGLYVQIPLVSQVWSTGGKGIGTTEGQGSSLEGREQGLGIRRGAIQVPPTSG